MSKRSERAITIAIHREFVAEIKAAVRKTYGSVPDPAKVLPTVVGAVPLDFKMPPMMEQAFGYRGQLRFVEFSYSSGTRKFGFSDGGDHVPSDEQLWKMFINHPLISSEIWPREFPTLFGKLDHQEERPQCRKPARGRTSSHHCLLFDRQTRRPYVCTWDQAIFFFPLTEPEGAEAHTLFVDGLLLSPGSEDYKPSEELRLPLEKWLDEELARDIEGES